MLLAAVALTYGQVAPADDAEVVVPSAVAEDPAGADLDGDETFFFRTYARPRYYGSVEGEGRVPSIPSCYM